MVEIKGMREVKCLLNITVYYTVLFYSFADMVDTHTISNLQSYVTFVNRGRLK